MKKTYEFALEYAKIFDREGKPGDIDRGDPKSTKKWLRELAKNPVSVVNCYFLSEEDMQDLLDCPEFENEVTNPQTGEKLPRIKEGNEELGIGKYIQLKRKLNDTIEFVDKKTDELKTIDKGGVPGIKILNEAGDTFITYDYDELGAPFNGTKAKVRFEVYKGNTRLEAFGVTELIEYVPGDNDEEEF